MEKPKESEEFTVANFGERKVKEEKELSTGQKLLEMMKRKKKCLSNIVYQGRCIPLNKAGYTARQSRTVGQGP